MLIKLSALGMKSIKQETAPKRKPPITRNTNFIELCLWEKQLFLHTECFSKNHSNTSLKRHNVSCVASPNIIRTAPQVVINKEIWSVPHLQHSNYFTCAGQRLRQCRCMSCQSSHVSLRLVYEIGLYWGRRSKFGSRSIRTPPKKTDIYILSLLHLHSLVVMNNFVWSLIILFWSYHAGFGMWCT